MNSQASFTLRGRNPDVLTCIANLSNDEVFTPPEFANRMLDTLAEAWAASHGGANIWADRTVKFLDPCTKSGVFLREITRRLTDGLANEIPNLEKRVNHILTQQVFGIGITQLTSLLARRSVYCSKHANGQHSIAKDFNSDAGNIWFERTEHTWDKGKCAFCGASQAAYDRSESMETHAYAFIHTVDIKTRIAELFGGNMRFDVIIGNPPYQLGSDGGTRDVPIYQHFVEQAKKLEPRYLAMIVPSRWMATGLGLNEFRRTMLSDRHLRALVDYPIAKEVFSGVEVKGGICYFLWDAEHDGPCQVTTVRGKVSAGPVARDLGEYDVFVRDIGAVSILHKVLAMSEPSVNTILSADKEFGWTSNFDEFHNKATLGDVPLYYVRKGKRAVGYISRNKVTKSANLIDAWKVMVPSAGSDGATVPDYVLSAPLIAPSPSVCTQTYLFFHVKSECEAASVQSYLSTRFFRFLVSLRKITQHATRSTYTWVPIQSWNQTWTDIDLYTKYGITKEEQEFIESQIRPVSWANGGGND
ncbi:restriction endonuclease [Candidatus Kaiserbacteria bacterium]|nr:restriction endonuclease [Candidatus Kaiserbacteria bacterium]